MGYEGVEIYQPDKVRKSSWDLWGSNSGQISFLGAKPQMTED